MKSYVFDFHYKRMHVVNTVVYVSKIQRRWWLVILQFPASNKADIIMHENSLLGTKTIVTNIVVYLSQYGSVLKIHCEYRYHDQNFHWLSK